MKKKGQNLATGPSKVPLSQRESPDSRAGVANKQKWHGEDLEGKALKKKMIERQGWLDGLLVSYFIFFAHGQLYVALSHCTSKDRVKVLFPELSDTTHTTNIVYPKVIAGFINH